MRRFTTLTAAAILGILGLAGCGDDADEAATTTTAEATTTSEAEQPDEASQVYCERSAEIDEQEGPPNEEQLQGLSEAAPPEIKADVDLVAERFLEQGLNAFEDPEVGEAIGRIEAFEEANCPGAADDEEEEAAAPQEPDPNATQVAVTATDAGQVAFVMTNEGDVPHEMGILKFKEGTTVEAAEQSFEDGNVQELVRRRSATAASPHRGRKPSSMPS